MQLSIQSVGKIKKADIEIKGITVLTGKNNTGKSTIGKTLYAVFNGYYNIEERIERELVTEIRDLLRRALAEATGTMRYPYLDAVASALIGERESIITDHTVITKILEENGIKNDECSLDNTKIVQLLMIPEDKIKLTIKDKMLFAEFRGQINSSLAPNVPSKITLRIRGNEYTLEVVNESVVSADNSLTLQTEPIYLDDPFVLESDGSQFARLRPQNYPGHRNALLAKVVFPKETSAIADIIKAEHFASMEGLLKQVCDGELVIKAREIVYRDNISKLELKLANVSTGIKTFAILKTLITNGSIEENGTIILDEPEIHLNPEWQLFYAELIVLLHKAFGLHVLLTTHSPYFVEAIEEYSRKHGVADACKYYLAQEDSDMTTFEDVTEQREKLYKQFAKPLQTLADVNA